MSTPRPRMNRPLAFAAALAAALVALAGCKGEPDLVRGGAVGVVRLPTAGQLSEVPLGDLAGATPNLVASTIANPYEGSIAAREEGHHLFEQMNCSGCHGYDGAGGMGPDLTDAYWRYGGSPAEIYKSIYEGRPKGMPAWGAMLPPQQLWKLVTYVESFGGSFPAQLANSARQGNLGGVDSAELSSMKGSQNEH